MNVATLANCKELYELSGWKPSHWWAWYGHREVDTKYEVLDHTTAETICPAYDLGYLLRKLPEYQDGDLTVRQHRYEWQAGYGFDGVVFLGIWNGTNLEASGDTPEDAACKLAIELFKQGVLNREEP